VKAVIESEKSSANHFALSAEATGVGARELEGCFPGFGAAVGEEDAVETGDLCEAEG